MNTKSTEELSARLVRIQDAYVALDEAKARRDPIRAEQIASAIYINETEMLSSVPENLEGFSTILSAVSGMIRCQKRSPNALEFLTEQLDDAVRLYRSKSA